MKRLIALTFALVMLGAESGAADRRFSFPGLADPLRNDVDQRAKSCGTDEKCYAREMTEYANQAREAFMRAADLLPERSRSVIWSRLRAYADDPERDYVEVAIATQNITHHHIEELNAKGQDASPELGAADRALIEFSNRVAQASLLGGHCDEAALECREATLAALFVLPDPRVLSQPNASDGKQTPPKPPKRRIPKPRPKPTKPVKPAENVKAAPALEAEALTAVAPKHSLDDTDSRAGSAPCPPAPGRTASRRNQPIQLIPSLADLQAIVGSPESETAALSRKSAQAKRLAAHRGKGPRSLFGTFRQGVESYSPAAKPGSPQALGEAKHEFTEYLRSVHGKIHRHFGEDFLAGLERLPGVHPLNRSTLHADLEIVLNPSDGSVVRMGLVNSSGVTAYDVAAMDAVRSAGPFGTAPESIVSKDGNIYFHWEFHRGAEMCGSFRPYRLER